MPQDEGNAMTQSPSRSCIQGKDPQASTPEGCERLDAKGNRIERGKKQHTATFVDEMKPGAHVEEVKEVAAYKGGPYGWGSEGGQSSCGCTLL
mmetsp:Transcript_44552/g.102872  ORF Transcript_44552/g.102872 Transcript_44552/m.102872 type:complete len:93 (+) Transcript_44552:220-498(+)